MKDNFSKQSAEYSKFRPQYPDEMIEHIVSFVHERSCALDVATGNGQVAKQLARHFEKVYATDISENQLQHAVRAENIIYKKESAEQTGFDDVMFDLVLVAQAIHWFDFDKFYDEVHRILKPTGIFAAIGYGNLATNPDSDVILRNFYENIIGPYWDGERRYLDENYETIPFPFDEIPTKKFTNHLEWSFDHLVGYLETWSATQHYKDKNNSNPIDLIRDELRDSWQRGNKQVKFPLLIRVGKLKPSSNSAVL